MDKFLKLLRDLQKDKEYRRLGELGTEFIRDQHQLDTYFYHPCRDFKRNDEALRVRVVVDKYF